MSKNNNPEAGLRRRIVSLNYGSFAGDAHLFALASHKAFNLGNNFITAATGENQQYATRHATRRGRNEVDTQRLLLAEPCQILPPLGAAETRY